MQELLQFARIAYETDADGIAQGLVGLRDAVGVAEDGAGAPGGAIGSAGGGELAAQWEVLHIQPEADVASARPSHYIAVDRRSRRLVLAVSGTKHPLRVEPFSHTFACSTLCWHVFGASARKSLETHNRTNISLF
jgi:hypothetical protein